MTEETPRTITSEEFSELVSRMRIRHIEEVERRVGKPLDEVMDIPEVGLRAHAIAYIVAVDRDPDATWDTSGEEAVMRLEGATAPAAEGPTPQPQVEEEPQPQVEEEPPPPEKP